MTAGAARVGRPRGGRGAKRTPADLEALSDKFASFVKANPGLRIEQINKELGTTTKDLALPIRKLISDGVITAKGQKRSTTYFAGQEGVEEVAEHFISAQQEQRAWTCSVRTELGR